MIFMLVLIPHIRMSNMGTGTALDAGAWMFNVVTSVGIIMVFKALMATQGF